MDIDGIFQFDEASPNPFRRSDWRCAFIPEAHYMPDRYYSAFSFAVEFARDSKAHILLGTAERHLRVAGEIKVSGHEGFLMALSTLDVNVDYVEYRLVGTRKRWAFWGDGNNAGLLSGDLAFMDAFEFALGGRDELRKLTTSYVHAIGSTFQPPFRHFVESL